MYGSLDNISLVTLAPEIPNAMEVIRQLHKRNIKISLGKTKYLYWIVKLDYCVFDRTLNCESKSRRRSSAKWSDIHHTSF